MPVKKRMRKQVMNQAMTAIKPNNMKKEEFLQKLKEIGFTPDAYDNENPFKELTDEFKFSEEIKNTEIRRDKAYETWKKHPGYNNGNLRDAEYERLYKEYAAVPNIDNLKEKEILESLELGEYTEVDAYGGEGQGDNYWKVLHFPKFDYYIRADGWYASYNGSDMTSSEWYFVEPKEKTITVYERADN